MRMNTAGAVICPRHRQEQSNPVALRYPILLTGYWRGRGCGQPPAVNTRLNPS
jgi:hypothetical protein